MAVIRISIYRHPGFRLFNFDRFVRIVEHGQRYLAAMVGIFDKLTSAQGDTKLRGGLVSVLGSPMLTALFNQRDADVDQNNGKSASALRSCHPFERKDLNQR
jgi:hypothetical protein